MAPPRARAPALQVSLPVRMFEPRSYLQKLADPWVYPHLLRRAAEEESAVQRMKLVITYFIAGEAGVGPRGRCGTAGKAGGRRRAPPPPWPTPRCE